MQTKGCPEVAVKVKATEKVFHPMRTDESKTKKKELTPM